MLRYFEHSKSGENHLSHYFGIGYVEKENYLSHFLGLEYLLTAMGLRRPAFNMNIFGHLHELQTYQQYKMAAILIAILDFVHFLVLEFLDINFNRFPVP